MPTLKQLRQRFYSILILWVCLCIPLSAEAEIFKYRGSNGGIHFTDKPMKGNYRLLWRSGKNRARNSNYSLERMRKNKAEVTPLIENIAKELHLHPGLLHAVVRVESAYNPKAISRKGAQGLMQLMPATANRYGVNDSYDPKQNLQGGAQYLRDLLKLFEFDIKLALAAYNAGENAVFKYGKKIPPYPETQNYVKKVLNEFERNRLAMLN
ncbi:MAG: lytic transglycosylase domain-containing protein [Candidatus Thiodiazotropha sp.]|nr:lytic transglycosylase domain-containing protein [Candidatus Thiodiazotropha sp.]MCU7805105.1 lytic transglycosylase domain-containing protein [Candidatus Thiodiazotropha sp. (ex Lucinoma borealis)]MCU7839824.1 lytic transglycosylase domain-containing protein [Candidatus Thiodiazotropha sp. (ex Troendleina suluensis)]MCU7883057.1 lytic transglycosylase domain-containing protein [Candidatus Thiodiazotropha sp. (ex Lucinoma annulata)]MCU7945378.1 lytic transglycosylase domain-containing protei